MLGCPSVSKSSIIFHAASVIRDDLKGIKNVSLNDSEITEDKAVELIPDSLFSFLKWIFEDSNTNKAELAKFLCKHWSSQYVACVPSGKMFFKVEVLWTLKKL